MILIIDSEILYETCYRKKRESVNLTTDELKGLQSYLKTASADNLERSVKMKFSTMTELTNAINQDRKSFPGSFYIKEIK